MIDKCFVIMPFGLKPFENDSKKYFDCDKVYRIIIKRAVENAGLEAIRADEKTGSHIIHSDMFKELRDRTVVLADLSLNNPNVYYELGIRHALSPAGTVLICREGTELPFDVRLSRVVFYRYNGVDLDWEEVEKVVPQLKAALETAKEQKPDSPVHALLERVFPKKIKKNPLIDKTLSETRADSGFDLQSYQKIVANVWHEKHNNIKKLMEQHKMNSFGARAIGELCLMSNPLPPETTHVARILYKHGQYELVCKIYINIRNKKETDANRLSPIDFINFGSALSEKDPTIKGAEAGIKVIREGLKEITEKDEHLNHFRLFNSLGGILMWKWQLSKEIEVFDEAINHLKQAKEYADHIISENIKFPIERVAKLFLRLLVLTRQREDLVERKDNEGYRDSILELDEKNAIDDRGVSYLRWYKAIALADAGSEESTHDMVVKAIKEDAILKRIGSDNVEIGSMQYTVLRRFIEDNSNFLRNHELLGYISQMLQYAVDRVSI